MPRLCVVVSLVGIVVCFTQLAGCIQAPLLAEPADGTSTVILHPHLLWQPACPPTAVNATCAYTIEIARDATFTTVLLSDRLPAVITRYVPTVRLAAGTTVYWRVGATPMAPATGWLAQIDSATVWSQPWSLHIRHPSNVFHVSSTASFHDMTDVVAKAVNVGDALVVFAKGSPRTLNPGSAQVFLNITGTSDVVVDGGGNFFTFSSYLEFIHVENSKHVLVMDLEVDFDPLPYTGVTVTEIVSTGARNSGVIAGRLLQGHPPFESFPGFETYGLGMLVDPRFPRDKRNTREVVTYSNVTGAAPNYKIAIQNNMNNVSVGDVFVTDPRIIRGFSAFGCDEVVFSKIVTHAMSNEGFNSEQTTKHSILSSGIVLSHGRYLAGNNGGHNHHSMRFGAWVSDGVWENCGDDASNFNALTMDVDKVVSSTEVHLRAGPAQFYSHEQHGKLCIDVGDTLQFWSRDAGKVLGESQVAAVTGPLGHGITSVTLATPVRGPIVPGAAGSPNVTSVYNRNCTNAQFVFRNSIVRNVRRIGILAHGTRGYIHNNTFQGLGGGALEGWDDALEGLFLEDYLFTDNLVNDTNQLDRYAAAIWTNSFRDSVTPGHKRIGVYNNTFAFGPGPTFIFNDAEHVDLAHNSIVRCCTDPTSVVSAERSLNIRFDASNTVTQSNDTWLCRK
eukprot:m.151587 g.151587  ORF g.151587 m.151587 type:complete len:673 (-) comp17414_c1_seq5:244-2262(-)